MPRPIQEQLGIIKTCLQSRATEPLYNVQIPKVLQTVSRGKVIKMAIPLLNISLCKNLDVAPPFPAFL